MSYLAPLVGAASSVAPLLQSRQQHIDELSATHALHERAIEQARELHDEQVAHADELHDHALRHAQRLHAEEVDVAHKHHAEALTRGAELHVDSKDLALRLHVEQLQQELMHHSQQMTHATETARRENLRDVWSQKTRKAETLLITNTLMFGCFFAVLVEGVPPRDTWYELIVLFAAALAVSFAFLFLCMWFTMKNQSRMASFNIYNKHQRYAPCGRTHANFESYYHCHCASLARLASQCFYVGSLALVIAASAFCVARFARFFENWHAAILYVSISGLTLVSLAFLHYLFPTATRVGSPNRDNFSKSIADHMARLHAQDIDPATIHHEPFQHDAFTPVQSVAGTYTQGHLSDVQHTERQAATTARHDANDAREARSAKAKRASKKKRKAKRNVD